VLRGTFAAAVTPNDPNRYSALPSSSSTAPSSGHSTNVTTAITAETTVVPRNTSMNAGRTAAVLIAFIAATPCAGAEHPRRQAGPEHAQHRQHEVRPIDHVASTPTRRAGAPPAPPAIDHPQSTPARAR
jgi:hypothetical protein